MWRKRNVGTRAINANVMVRYLTGDDPDQSARAQAAVDGRAVFASTTVLLESERVLRSVYGFAPEEVAVALRPFAGLPGVAVKNPDLLAAALDRAGAGMNVAGSLHLGAAARCDAMLTFDRRFIEQAQDSSVRMLAP